MGEVINSREKKKRERQKSLEMRKKLKVDKAKNKQSKRVKALTNKKNPFNKIEEKICAGVIIAFLALVGGIIVYSSVNPKDVTKTPEYYLNNPEYSGIDEVQDAFEIYSGSKEFTGASPIAFWGDDFSIAADEITPSFIAYISDNYTSRTIYNISVPGESLINVAAKQGAIPMVVESFDVPADKSPVQIELKNSEGKAISLKTEKNGGLNPCSINGISGEISVVDGISYFTRSYPGDMTNIIRGSVVNTYAMDVLKDEIFVFFINYDATENAQEIFDIYSKIIDYLPDNNQKFLIMGTLKGSDEDNAHLDNMLSQKYADKYFNTREVLCQELNSRTELVPDNAQLEKLSQGIVPDSMFKGSGLSDNCAQILASRVFEKLGSLDYF